MECVSSLNRDSRASGIEASGTGCNEETELYTDVSAENALFISPAYGLQELQSSPNSSREVARRGPRWRGSPLVGKLAAAAGKLSSDVLVWVTSVAIVVLVAMTGPEASNALVMAPRKLQGDELATVQLFQENTPSVVYITNLAVRYFPLSIPTRILFFLAWC